jgi:hypothetical protein
MTPEGAEVLIDYAKLHRYGVGCCNLQLDLTHKKMYWVETGTTWGGNSIVCANLDGSGFRVVVDRHPLHPWNFAIDAKGGKIYWVNMGRRDDTGRSIERADLDGSHPKTIVPLVAVPSGIAIDPLDRKLYYFDAHDLMRSELDGGGETRIAVDPSEGVRVPLLIEHQSKRIYWGLGTWVNGLIPHPRATFRGRWC